MGNSKSDAQRKLIVMSFITLDGIIQAPGGPDEDTSDGFKYGGWVAPFSDEILGEVMKKQMSLPFSLLLGKKTYDIWADYWPHHENSWPGINDLTKYVASHNASTKLEWNNSILLSGNVASEIEKLKMKSGPDLHIYGSGSLIQTLLKNDLVDELRLKIFPITLGSGKRLFENGVIPAAFKLSDSKISSKGVIIADYERAGDVETGSI